MTVPNRAFTERTSDDGWDSFTPFLALPALDWKNPNLRWIDLTGDGFPDLLISEDDTFWWYESLAKMGFGAVQRVQQSYNEETGPKLLLADSTESIFMADMSGDGLTDLVRIRNGEVCYWPNLGYGRFGAKVTMDNAPVVRGVRPFRWQTTSPRRYRWLRHRRSHLSRHRRCSSLLQRLGQRVVRPTCLEHISSG